MGEVGRVRTGNWSQFVTLSGEETFPLGHSHWGNFRIRDRDIFGRALATGCALVPREKARQPYLPYLAKIEKYRGQTMRVNPGLLDSRCSNTRVALQTPENHAPR
jgi:hypothetical protein